MKDSKSNALKYIGIAIFTIIANLLWYRFSNAPIGGNSGFYIFPARTISEILQPYNLYSWPISYIPPILGFPNSIFYDIAFFVSSGSYSFGIFFNGIIIEIFGAISIFYIVSQFLAKVKVNRNYAYISVIFLLFNEIIVEGAQFDTAASTFVILFVLIFLSITFSKKYILLFGIFSVYLLSGFPGGTLTYAEEIVASLIVIVIYKMLSGTLRLDKPHLKHVTYVILLLFFATVLANAYMIWPAIIVFHTFFGALSSASPNYAFSFAFDTHETFFNAVRFIDNWAEFSGFAPTWFASYFGLTWVKLLLYIPFVFSLISIKFIKRKAEFFIYGIFLVLIFLSKANNPPLGSIFSFLITKISLLRPFYGGGTAFSPFLILAYALLIPLTTFRISVYVNEKIRWRLRPKHSKFMHSAKLLLPVFIVSILLIASVYPLLSTQVVQGNPTTPLTSSLPEYYYNASSALEVNPGPVMVFPSINTFTANEVNGTVWYNGINIYPGVIYEPSISGYYPLNYEGGKGTDTYKIIQNIYTIHSSVPRLNLTPESLNNTSLISGMSFRAYLTVDNTSVSNNTVSYTVNENVIHGGGQWLIGNFHSPKNLTSDKWLYLSYKLDNMNVSDISIGIFSGGTGNWYILTSYNSLSLNGGFTLSEIPINDPTFAQGLNISNVTAIVVDYGNNHLHNGTGNFKLNYLGINPGIKPAYLLAQDMNIMGLKYAFVDTSTTSGNGSLYNRIFSSNNTLFTEIFHQGTITIYDNNRYSGPFEGSSSIFYFNSTTSLFNELYDNTNSHTFINQSEFPMLSQYNITPISNIEYHQLSSSSYSVNVVHNGTSLLFFKTDYSPNWIASSGNHSLKHVKIDGYANGWLIPRGITNISISYSAAPLYSIVETITIAFPVAMVILYFIPSSFEGSIIDRLRKGINMS